MNRLHRWYCRCRGWKRRLENEVLPWSLRSVDLGEDVLEIGPGPGLTTDWLGRRCKKLTCLEIDPQLANSLAHRTAQTNISVQCGDATAMPYLDRTFSSVVALTVLHHIPSPTLQDRLFAEAYRVLRPGGVFAGTDQMSSLLMRLFHIGDTMVLVDPVQLESGLGALGFVDVSIEIRKGKFRFFARRPAQS